MKHLATLLTMAIAFTGLGQQMPYNPDANGDDFVGVDDVLGVLGVYDTALMQPDLQCDYEGTDLEQLFGDWISGAIVMDSIYVEYLVVDTINSYSPNCPESIQEEVVLERSFMLNSPFDYVSGSTHSFGMMTFYLDYQREVQLTYDFSNGFFGMYYYDQELSIVSSGQISSWSYPWGYEFTLPFASDWHLDEDGVQISWEPGSLPAVSESFRLIPYWHAAE